MASLLGERREPVLMTPPPPAADAPASSVFSCEVRDLHPGNPLLAALAALRSLQTVHSGSNSWAAVIRLRSGRWRPVAVFASEDRAEVDVFATGAVADLDHLTAVEFARKYVHPSVRIPGVWSEGTGP